MIVQSSYLYFYLVVDALGQPYWWCLPKYKIRLIYYLWYTHNLLFHKYNYVLTGLHFIR